MQKEVQQWIKTSLKLKKGLETWTQAVNKKDSDLLLALYHPKARVFPTFGSLKVGKKEIGAYLSNAQNTTVTLHFGTISYNIEDNLIEGEYTFHRSEKADVRAKFAMKFDSKGLIVEQASAPSSTKSWYLKSEVSVCTLLTAATVKSVLKETELKIEENPLLTQIIKESSSPL